MEMKTVKDLMVSIAEYATVPAEASLRDALRALDNAQLGLTDDRHHHRAVLVLDDTGAVIGKLSHWAILRSLEPRFFTSADTSALDAAGFSSEFIGHLEEGLTRHFGNLEFLCEKASRIKAKAAMVPAGESIDASALLIEAIHQLVVTHVQSLPVTRGEKTVGILRLSDVFEAVADIIRRGEGDKETDNPPKT
jgi:CBS domain-containing protein